jgi:hypothetical protein
MLISFDFINGVSVGMEYVDSVDEDFEHTIILDLLLVRFLFQW